MFRSARSALVLCIAVSLCACPSRVTPNEQQSGRVTKADDPRVVRDGTDLYVAEAPSAPKPKPSAPAEGLGVGKPDETNGVCRLFAPKLKKPICCGNEYGFDAERAKATCGHQLYLGEHFRASCGYYFTSPDQPHTWFRGGFVPDAKDPKAAADSHDALFQRRAKRLDFHSQPIPGIPGGFWSEDNDLNWAFLPGWSQVRRITWRDDACDEQKIFELLKEIASAKEPPKGAEREGLIPKARG
jgi:hypothetical protein